MVEIQVNIWSHLKYNATERQSESIVLTGVKPCSYKTIVKKTLTLRQTTQTM